MDYPSWNPKPDEPQPFADWWSSLSQDERNKNWHAIDLIRIAFKAGRKSVEAAPPTPKEKP